MRASQSAPETYGRRAEDAARGGLCRDVLELLHVADRDAAPVEERRAEHGLAIFLEDVGVPHQRGLLLRQRALVRELAQVRVHPAVARDGAPPAAALDEDERPEQAARVRGDDRVQLLLVRRVHGVVRMPRVQERLREARRAVRRQLAHLPELDGRRNALDDLEVVYEWWGWRRRDLVRRIAAPSFLDELWLQAPFASRREGLCAGLFQQLEDLTR